MKKKYKVGFFPILYILFFAVWQYSVNDMATSTNAYQEQGNRTAVYIYLIAILLLLFAYVVLKRYIRLFVPSKVILLMTLWIALDNLLLGNLTNGNQWSCLTHIGLSAWWFLALQFGYQFTRDDGQDNQREKQLVFFLLVMLCYYSYQFVKVFIDSNSASDETTVLNLIYRVIVFLPILYLLENKRLRNFFVLAVVLMTVMSMKRGAIVIVPLMLFPLVREEWRQKKDWLGKLAAILGLILLAVIGFQVVDRLTNGFLSYRFSPEQLLYGSSRSEKYAAALQEISQRGIASLMLGVGSAKRAGIHNEILEFLYTFGVVGLVMYLALIGSMLARCLSLYKRRSAYASKYLSALLFIVVVGVYSGVYFTHSTFYIMLYLGILEGKIEKGDSIHEQNRRDYNPSGGQLRGDAASRGTQPGD